MSAEIIWSYVTGKSGYALVRSSSGTIFNRVAGAFEAYDPANYLTYQMSGREQSSGRTYVADFPTAVTVPGYYNIEARDQIAGSGLQSDQTIAEGELWWNGSAVIVAADLRSGHVSVSGVFVQSGLATAVQVSGIATGFAFVSGVFVQSGIATSVQVSGLATYANISGITHTFVSGVLFASGGAVGWLLSGKDSLSGIVANSGIFVQSGLATAVQVSGIGTGFAFVSGVFVQSGARVMLANASGHGGDAATLLLEKTRFISTSSGEPAIKVAGNSGGGSAPSKAIVIHGGIGQSGTFDDGAQAIEVLGGRGGPVGSGADAVTVIGGGSSGQSPGRGMIIGGGFDGLNETFAKGLQLGLSGYTDEFGLDVYGHAQFQGDVQVWGNFSVPSGSLLCNIFEVRTESILSLTTMGNLLVVGPTTFSGAVTAIHPSNDIRGVKISGGNVSGVFPASGFATAVQVSGVATGFAFVSGVFVQSGIATSVQVSGILSGITQANVSGVLIASGGMVPGLLSGIWIQSGITTSLQVSGVALRSDLSGMIANVSGTPVASGFATAVQVSGLAPWASVSGLYPFLPIQLPKGRSFDNFPFPLYQSGTNTALTSGVVSGMISKDAAAFGLLQSGSFLEMGLGWYNCQYLTSGDLNANSVALRFVASGSDVRDITIITQRN